MNNYLVKALLFKEYHLMTIGVVSFTWTM